MNPDNNFKVGIVDDERCEYHVQYVDHQESPDRIRAIRQKLIKEGLYNQLIKIQPTDPTKNDLLLAHTSRYINKVERTCMNYKTAMIDCNDVRVSGENSLISAGVAVGGVLGAVNTVINSNTIKKVYCNIRPPGHHAHSTRADGFCIFNNVAIGARKALSYDDINKVLIFDWDLHHGNGTQSIFKCSKNVMYASFHRAPPFYPNTGLSRERGKYDNIYNYPQHKDDGPEEYMKDFYQKFLPEAIDFEPDIIFISCGFDSHKDDLYKALPLDYSHFELMTKELCQIANKFCKGRLVSVLEGGYTLPVLAKCAYVHVKALLSSR